MVSARWLISGVVQGVGFRAFVAREAARLGVVGTVANLPDGRVEVVAAGEDSAVRMLRALVEKGPIMASEINVENAEILVEMTAYNRFSII